MIVDAHCHILPDRVRADRDTISVSDPWFGLCHAAPRARLASAAELVAAMDEDGVDVAVCLAWPFADPALCAEGNDHVAAAVRAHPGRLVGFGCVQPADPGAVREVRRCVGIGLSGVGELNADAQGWSLAGPEIDAVIGAATDAGLPLTLHCSEPVGHAYAGKGGATPDRVAAVAKRHPEARLILAHLGGGLPFYAHMPEVRELCRRVWFDTAAVPYLYEPSAYRQVVEMCGAERLLAASDFPLLRLPRVLAGLDQAGIEPGARATVAGAGAAGLLGLSGR